MGGNVNLAQTNIAIFRWPIDDPRMAEFRDQIRLINNIAEKSDGFVWRFTDTYALRDIGPPWDNPLLFFNMSVWRDHGSLLRFVRSREHAALMHAREQWLLPVSGRSSALWWIDEPVQPTIDDAITAILAEMSELRSP